MKTDVFRRAKSVFGDAVELPAPRRAAFVERACAGDADLLAEVRSLLEARDAVSSSWLGGAGLVVATIDAGRASAPSLTESGRFDVGPAPSPDPTTGSVVAGRYELGARLGAGAFGAVYAAKDRVSQQSVAVKMLPLAGGAGFKMLRRETAILRLVKLPGVVEMIDDGIDGLHAFIAMRLVEGEPFAAAGPTTWDALAPRARSLLEALARLHWVGVVHRDIKPENVLVGTDGRVTIVDLGIAWEGEGSSPASSGGYVAGTPAYLAPECLLGRPASVASDLYSVGVMLFEALTGRRLHEAKTFDELRAARRDAPAPPLASLAPGVAPHVAAAVDAMLARDPKDRPASAAHALASLEGEGAKPPGLRPPRVGGSHALDLVVLAAKSGRSIDVGGPRGSGRTRLLEDAAERLAADGFLVVRALPAERPFESLAPVVGRVPDHDAWSADEVRAWAERRLTLALSDGFVVFADDVASLDDASQAALAACRARGRVVRVVVGDGADVVLGPIAEIDLRPLFRGPDRIHHLREDGARELFRRTRGLPSDVVRELTAWIDQGYARFEDGLVVVDRAGLDRLAARVLVSPPVRPELGAALGGSARALSTYFALAGGPIDPRALAHALGRPAWEIDLDVEALARAGVVVRGEDGRVEALAAVESHAALAEERRREIHSALADAVPREAEHRLAHLLAAGRLDAVPRAACDVAGAFMRAGRPNRALVVASEGAGVLGRAPNADADVEEELLFLLMDSAIGAATPQALDLALYRCARARHATKRVNAVETVCRAARSALQGDVGRALAALDSPFCGFTADLERWRHVVRAFASRSEMDAAIEARVASEAAEWVRRDPRVENRGLLAEITGWLRYRQGRFAAAASLHQRRARLARELPRHRVAALLNAAAASLEAFELDSARRFAERAAGLLVSERRVVQAIHAEFILRAVDYRSGSAVDPDLDLVEAAVGTGSPNLEAAIRMNEAAVAWRAGNLDLARRLATDAVERFRRIRRQGPVVLLRAFLTSMIPRTDESDAARLLDECIACTAPGMAAQAIALAAPSLPGDRHVVAFDAAVARLDGGHDAKRREFLSIEEAEARVRPRFDRRRSRGQRRGEE